MNKPDGGPAFPSPERIVGGWENKDGEKVFSVESSVGMSLRDYFAAKAMHAELNTAGAFDDPAEALITAAEIAGRTIEQQIAFNAYKLADAMIVQRLLGAEDA